MTLSTAFRVVTREEKRVMTTLGLPMAPLQVVCEILSVTAAGSCVR
jgi:hypothetical protein